ncbi:hypothetical protein KDA23_00845 [Candidatus Saccharibacteria bacterium]|nr:hypothetical protein [Candidatus Saccharibacteria bacterium]
MRRFVGASLVSLLLSVILLVPAAGAWSPFSGVDCSKAPNSAVCADKGQNTNPLLPSPGDKGLLMKIVDIIALVAGAAAVIIIIVSGLRFITAGGNAEDIAGARRGIIYAAVGIVVIALARALIFVVLSKL